MTAINAGMIKELRERTGVGMGKCKEALEEAKGDMELAIENLRKSGAASAVKKAGRETKEGQIASAENSEVLAIVEVNAETDFVVKNDRFQDFLKTLAQQAVESKPASLEALLEQKYAKDTSMTVEQQRADLVQTIGENIQIRRVKLFPKNGSRSFGVYSHLGGKIVTVVEIEGAEGEETLAKDIAMHVAAASPDYLTSSEVPESILAQERDIAKTQMAGKPDNIIEKILGGKIEAFYDQVCLDRQKFIRDDSLSITQLVDKRGKEAQKPLKLARFIRWNVGQ